jgi:hypothetical protein
MRDHRVQIEVHIAHACNLTCESCSHFSNYHLSGILSLDTAETWYRAWAHRFSPDTFSLVGGEPTINPKLTEHLLLARRYWPQSHIRIITNGLLIHRHPQLPVALKQVGNALLQLSRHYDKGPYHDAFQSAVKLICEWKRDYGIGIRINNSYTSWTRRYQDVRGELKPFNDNDIKRSWSACRCKWCMQLHDGKLWKCPLLAYLPMVQQKVRLSPEWSHALTYQPLKPSCTDQELTEFLGRREESYCVTCPAFDRHFGKMNPM